MFVSRTKIMLSISAMLIASSAFAADIKIGVIGPYTNSSSIDFGTSIKEGAMLAAAEINAKGGVLGQKIVLVSYDDKSKPDVGAEVAKSAVDKKVVAAVGAVNLGVVLKMIPVFQTAKIPYIITASAGGATPSTYANEPTNYIFRLASTDAGQASLLGKHVIDIAKHTKIAIFADDTVYGSSGLEYLTKVLAERKLTPLIVERISSGTGDVSESVERARAAGADAVITWTLGPEAAAIKVGINRIGWRIPVYGSWTLSSQFYSNNAGMVSAYSSLPVTITHDSNNPVYQQFASNYREMHHRSIIPNVISAAQTYDSIYLLAMAIQQAGTTEGPKLVEALENINGRYDGVLTSYQKPWSKSNHEFANVQSLLKLGVLQNNGTIKEATN